MRSDDVLDLRLFDPRARNTVAIVKLPSVE